MADEPVKHILSKSTFVRGQQCHKSLFLYKNFIHLRDPISAERKALFSRGTDVGIIARKLFPGGIDVSPAKPSLWHLSVEKTRELIAGGTEVIYEAAFQTNQVLAAVDILVKKQNKWYAYEVKSSTRISPVYITDAALQYHVISASGLPLEDFFIVNINSSYTRSGDIEIEKLFNCISVKKEVTAREPDILHHINIQKELLLQNRMPDIPIGEHCFFPYPCDFKGVCWKTVPGDSVFELGGITKPELFSLYHSGMKRINDIPDNFIKDNWVNTQVKSFKTNQPVIQLQKLKEFIAGLRYPLHFMDFETFMPAVPFFNGTKPFQHLPFQFSLHCKNHPGDQITHDEFLAEAGMDPRKKFIESLLNILKTDGDILVYGAAFERSILTTLQKEIPHLATPIQGVLNRLKDLMQPFEENWYYHPGMKGSYSIKNVLPALVAQLSYHSLPVSNGNIAMAAYEQLHQETDLFKIMEIREQLLEYCKLDTLGMVKILERLEKEVGAKNENPG